MCYCNCKYEYYPQGPNEDCHCRRRDNPCPADEVDRERDRLEARMLDYESSEEYELNQWGETLYTADADPWEDCRENPVDAYVYLPEKEREKETWTEEGV